MIIFKLILHYHIISYQHHQTNVASGINASAIAMDKGRVFLLMSVGWPKS